MSEITVFPARRVLTMDPGRPFAEAVAVRDGRVLSTGTLDSMEPWLSRSPYRIDDTLRDKVIMPGLIDPHTHFAMSGSYLALLYIGPIDSPSPNGTNPGLRSMKEVLATLAAAHGAEPDANKPLIAWG